MLTINGRNLSGELRIDSPDTTIYAKPDRDCALIGVLAYKDGTRKTIRFVARNGVHEGRLILTKDDLKGLQSAQFRFELIAIGSSCFTNHIEPKLDMERIRAGIFLAKSDDVVEMRKEIEQLRLSFDAILSGRAIPKIEMADKLLEPGMIPVAIDTNGTFVGQFPFSDCAKSVNGQPAVEGSIVIDAKMIEYERGTSVAQYLALLESAITALNERISAIRDRLSSVSDQLNALELRVSSRIDGGSM